MIRVCVVAPRYMTGGQAIEARTLLDGFRGDRDVQLDLQPIDPRLPAWLAALRGVRTVCRMPLYLAGLVRRVRRADVVHVFTAGFSPFLLTTTPAILLARVMGRPVILNYRDGRAERHLRGLHVQWILRRATRLAFPSGFLRDLFRDFGFDGTVVYNTVDEERFRFRERVPLRPVLISSRLLEELYAVENTLRAFAELREMYPEARLLVAGTGDREAALRALVRDEKIEGVEFLGGLSHAEVARAFDSADIFVNSSREDNMPHSIIEAYSSGLPVVTTGVGGIPYIVEHGRTALVVPTDDPAAMAGAARSLLEDSDLSRRLVREGQAECRQRYGWTAASSGWRRLYREMAGVGEAPPGEVHTDSPEHASLAG